MPRPIVAVIAATLALTALVPVASAASPPQPADELAGSQPVPAAAASVEDVVPQREPVPEELPARRGQTVSVAMAESVPHVGAPSRWTAGHRGAGQVIVVIDSGVASDFGGTIVGQACFVLYNQAPDDEPADYVGKCGPARDQPEAFSSDCYDLGVCDGSGAAGDDEVPDTLDEAAARPCDGGDTEACRHGSQVAAVAARAEPTPGVAPDADVYAIQVFHDPAKGDLVDVLLALWHTIDLIDAGLDVAAVNLSLGTKPSELPCGHPNLALLRSFFEPALAQLAARGVLVAAAAGNEDGFAEQGFPACLPGAVSVGSTDLADDVSAFSNIGPDLDLFAPGERGPADSQGLVIPSPNPATAKGTSFSAPHVAGAMALLREELPKASAEQLRWYLQASGVPIATPYGNVPRLQMRDAEEVLYAGVLFPDSDPVTGTPTAVVGDFDGDGRADVFGHAPGSPPDHVAFGSDTDWGFSRTTYAITGSYHPLVGNFWGDPGGPDDIFWYAPGSAPDSMWVGAADRTFGSIEMSVRGTYRPVVGDFDGDDFDDIFWYAPGPAADFVWYGGASGFTSVPAPVRGDYRVVVGDFNDDDRDDIFIHGPGSAPDAVWLGRVDRTFDSSSMIISGSYTLVLGDFDGDSADDVFLYQPGSGVDVLWSGGPAVGAAGGRRAGFEQTPSSVNGTYAPFVGDFNGDVHDDIYWYAPGPTPDYLWFAAGAGSFDSMTTRVSGSYRPLAADFDGDDGDDIVWAQGHSLDTFVWWSYVADPPAP